MLKSPRYSATRVHQSEPFDFMQYQSQANKENFKSEGYEDTTSRHSRGLGKNEYDSPNAYQSAGQIIFPNKARSSLAASSYHAMGRLPQYDGAGEEALSSSNFQTRPALPQHDGSSSGPERKKTLPDGSAADPTISGPCSRLEQAKLYDVGPTDTFDYRGLTSKDFSTMPDRPSNARSHYQDVDRYFDRLRAEELLDISTELGSDSITHRRL